MYTFTDAGIEEQVKHLRLRKRRELVYITKTLLKEFGKMRARETDLELRKSRILKLILYGSHARGTQVEDWGSGYFSDYDLLAVVDNEKSADSEYWYDIEEVLLKEELEGRMKTPVELIVHSYQDIDRQLAVQRPFFMDIMRDGIVLYENKYRPFDKSRKMTEKQQRKEAQGYFNDHYESSLAKLSGAKFCFGRRYSEMGSVNLNLAAFSAYQAAEYIYHCLLLTLTLYSPKLHNLRKLRSLANAIAPQLTDVWPQNKRFYKRRFELLHRAYVEARYSPHYKITAEELQWLFERIEDLQNRVKILCEARLQR